ncbi:PilZ domain-containing protein [Pseudomonas sp. LRF_L74]|uniref:PilZ domain-containing protein n=1 Tax=Pseudomonas sp. LRF_L74 TaxID=3369422 RepID=UPI003F625314
MSAVISPIGNNNLVHESEAQRQYARLKLPAKIRYFTPEGQQLEAPLIDVSAGGFSFESNSSLLSEGKHFHGKLLFEVDGIGFAMAVDFQVRSTDGKRVGCEFHNLRPREISALRYMISSFMSGELINVGDLLNTLQRENFTKARNNKAPGTGGLLSRIREAGVSSVIFLVGVAACAYVAYQLYDIYFITHADSAQVVVPGQEVAMPREGAVQSLVQVGAVVKKGAPVATYSATMLDALKNILPESEMTPENLERLFSKNIQGTLTSPCDCRVVSQVVGDGQVATKGATVFTLAPLDSVASVEARFKYRSFAKLQPGTEVNFLVAGEKTPRGGVIDSISLQDGGLASDIRVLIKPTEPLANELVKRPVDVRIQPIGGLWTSAGGSGK